MKRKTCFKERIGKERKKKEEENNCNRFFLIIIFFCKNGITLQNS